MIGPKIVIEKNLQLLKFNIEAACLIVSASVFKALLTHKFS